MNGHNPLLDAWLSDPRLGLCREAREAVERYAEAHRQLGAAMDRLRRAQRDRQPAHVIAEAHHGVQVAAAVERLAHQHAAQLLGETTTADSDGPTIE